MLLSWFVLLRLLFHCDLVLNFKAFLIFWMDSTSLLQESRDFDLLACSLLAVPKDEKVMQAQESKKDWATTHAFRDELATLLCYPPLF
jgi:hypothetical protein